MNRGLSETWVRGQHRSIFRQQEKQFDTINTHLRYTSEACAKR